MAERNVYKGLKRLFSRDVVVRRIGKNKLKVVDSSKLQSTGNIRGTKYIDRFTRLHGTRHKHISSPYGTYGSAYNYYGSKTELYTDYEMMDKDPIISSALDIYADETTVESERGEILTIKSDNEDIVEILDNLFYDILNIEFNLWSWIRNMCKYGDSYLELNIQDNLGIVNVEPLSTYEVIREENNDESLPYKVRFYFEGEGRKRYYENFEIAHFRLLSDSNFLPYGRAMVEGARKTWKQLTLMEDAMLISRIMRAPERRIFKIDIGNIPPNEVDQYMQKVIDKMKKIPYIDDATGDYNLKFNLQSMLEDYYLPVRGGQSGTEIDTLSGMEWNGIDDIEYLRNKMMAALKIPKSFLGYEEGVEGKCISPETKIPLLNGEVKTVSDIIDDYENGIKHYVYSLDVETNNIVPGEIEWAGYTRMNTNVVRVWLDNDKYVDCTPDHKFLTRDNNWVESKDLKINQSLMPLYLSETKQKNKNGYTTVYNPSTGKYNEVHRIVAEYYNLIKSGSGKVVHHKDFNKKNNYPDNFDCSMYYYEHRNYHKDNCEKTLNSIENIEKRITDPKWLKSASCGGKIGGLKSGKKLAEWIRKNGQWNKKSDLYKNCCVCGKKVKIPHCRENSFKICSNLECRRIYFSESMKNKKLYNEKYSNVDYNILLESAKNSRSFKELSNNLGIDVGTLNKVFNYHKIDKNSFIINNMPLALENKNFMKNFKNHKVTKVEYLDEKIDTCDINVKKYHNFGIDSGIIIHNSTLASEDVRFARTIGRLQKIILSELTKIAIIHLYVQGYEDEELVNFELSLTNPSIIYDQEKLSLLNEKITTASSMKDLRMISNEYIYKNVFGMSKEEYEKEQNNVIEDIKREFRLAQIENEGNDPAKTGESFGTPHDLAAMNLAGGENADEEDENDKALDDSGITDEENKGGRPKDGIKIGTDKHPRGRDPFGSKEMKKVFKKDSSPLRHTYKKGSPLSLSHKQYMKSLIDSGIIKSKRGVIEELYKKNNEEDENNYLDESNLTED